MPIDPKNIDYMKALHIKQIGIALASIWVIVLVAAVAATIYREIDGPTVRSAISENINIASINAQLSSRNDSLESTAIRLSDAQDQIRQLNAALESSRQDQAELRKTVELYFSEVPLRLIGR